MSEATYCGHERCGAPAGAITRQARHTSWFLLAGLSAMFIVSVLWHPPDEPIVNLCPFRALTGWPCPGCGMTRAFCALGHGELSRAIHFNALSPLLYLALIAVWASAAATLLNLPRVRGALMALMPNALVTKLIFAGVLVWWVVRLAYGF